MGGGRPRGIKMDRRCSACGKKIKGNQTNGYCSTCNHKRLKKRANEQQKLFASQRQGEQDE